MQSIAALAVSVVAVALGCGAPPRGVTSAKAGPEHRSPAPKLPAIVHQEDAFKYLPASTQLVIGLDVRALTEATLLRPYVDRLIGAVPELGWVRRRCGFDPLTAIDWVVGGVVRPGDVVLVISGGFNRTKLLDCVRESARADGSELVLKEDSGVESWGYRGDEDSVVLFWPADGVVVVGRGERRVLIDEAKRESGPGDDVAARVAAADRSAAVWGAGRLPRNPFRVDVQGVELSVHARASLALTARFDFETGGDAIVAAFEVEAALIVAKANPLAQPVLAVLDAIDITQAEQSFTIAASLSTADLEALKQAAKLGGVPW